MNAQWKWIMFYFVVVVIAWSWVVWPRGFQPREQFDLSTNSVLVLDSSGTIQADNTTPFVLWNSVTQQTLTSVDNIDGTFSVTPTQATAGTWLVLTSDEGAVSIIATIAGTTRLNGDSLLFLTVFCVAALLFFSLFFSGATPASQNTPAKAAKAK